MYASHSASNEDYLVNCRVLFVVNDIGFFYSHRADLARALRARGAEVFVAAPPTTQRGQSHDEFETFEFPLARWGMNPFHELKTVVSLAKLYRAVAPTIVHQVTIKPILYGSIAARMVGMPAIVNAVSGRGQMFSGVSLRYRFRAGLLNWLYQIALWRLPTRVIFQNSEDRDYFVQKGIVPEEAAVLIKGSGVTPRTRPRRARRNSLPAVVLAARMLRSKGIVEFVQAAAILRSRGIKCRCIVAGATVEDNPDGLSLSDVQQLREIGCCEIVGYCPTMDTLWSEADIACLPTYYNEGVPRSLLEAASWGLPIVTTDWPGCRDLVQDGVSGILVPPRDAIAIADALQSLIISPSLRATMGAAGCRRIETEGYSFDSVFEKTVMTYHELLSAGRSVHES